ncbi:MAG: hypothetical protein IJW45_01060 [Oscillospiraceae bacterium]|nr:hypothetical protein [Oscillospiraceae bacterium]
MRIKESFRVLLCCLLTILLAGCDVVQEPQGEVEEEFVWDNTEVMPEHVIQIGDEFEYTPEVYVEGHFLCTVTDVRVVQDEAECPPPELWVSTRLAATVEGECVYFQYDEWFTEGGAYDHGCRVILVDVTMTNVDAESELDDGTCEGGPFNDPYLFTAYNVVNLVNLSYVQSLGGAYHSFHCYYPYHFTFLRPDSEDDRETLGNEQHAIRIAPGETVSFTLGFSLDAEQEGEARDLSQLMLSVGANTSAKEGVFIDPKLGDDVE